MGSGQNGLLVNQKKMNRKLRRLHFFLSDAVQPKKILQQYDNIIAHGQIANRRAKRILESQMGIGYLASSLLTYMR